MSELAPPRQSDRAALARIAHESALAVRDVVGTAAGPLGAWVTEADDERLPGIVAAAQADGRYALDLHLIARPVPLHELAERVRERIVRAAERAGLGGLLGAIDVSIEDVELAEGEA